MEQEPCRLECLDTFESERVSKSLSFPFLICRMMLILIRMMTVKIKKEKVKLVYDVLLTT